jgi:SM-20-related protein
MQQMYNPFDLLIGSYLENKVGIDEAFLDHRLCSGLRENILQLQNDQMMVAAGIGNEPVRDALQKMRGDKIYWLDSSHDNDFEKEFLERVTELVAYLNRSCYAGLNSHEFHYAVYGEGSHYKRHLDQFRNDGNRKFSLICYLNKEWLEKDGGHLLVHHPGKVQSIAPRSGTAVFFKSDEMEHEVAPSNRPRMSITGWLKRV